MSRPAGPAVAPREAVGAPIDRVDGHLKVTGTAIYAAEHRLDGVVHGVLVTSSIASGRILHTDRELIQAMPGVLLAMTHENAPELPEVKKAAPADLSVRALSLLQDDVVHYNGEPIGVVVADTLERATDAAHRMQIQYQPDLAALDIHAHLADAYPAPNTQPNAGAPNPKPRGDPDAALDNAPVRIDATYVTPMEHHNAMEPHAVTAVWNGDNLTVYDTTQSVSQSQRSLAKRLGLKPEQVHIVSPFVGGGFGSKGSMWSHVVLAAMAARVVAKPVRLAVTRRQMFGPVGGRPTTIQHMSIGADRDGALAALRHDCTSHTSVMEDWTEMSTSPSKMMYAVPNLAASQRLVALNVGVPTFQRAPGESTGNFALESAMDELAYALPMDPLALRLRNYADQDPESNHPWSSKALRECYRVAAERFGWSRRTAAPRSMRRGETLVGWGMATAAYPSHASKATCRARLEVAASGVRAVFTAGTQDLGTGTYTVMTQVAADAAGVTPADVRFELGDSSFPVNPISGGSQTAASTGSGVHAAGLALREKLIELATGDPDSPVHGARPEQVIVVDAQIRLRAHPARAERLAALLARHHGAPVEVEATWSPEAERKQYGTSAFGAVFVEVHIDDRTCEVRVPRIVAAYGANVLNHKLAESQLLGGIVWGVGMALTEASLLDTHYGRFVNADLAEYHVPVNADIQEIDITIVPEPDTIVNPIGVKGLGEIGITGAPAAIANAVYHATGIRVRQLPITLDALIGT